MGSEIIFHYFPELSDKQKVQFSKLFELYSFWNAQINLISRKDMENFYLHHVLHSLAIAKIVRFKDFTEVMDAGTGGGFPGIPLAIMFPGAKFYLVDSIGKKIKVVNEVIAALGITNVETANLRMEQVTRTFDFIVSRAVTTLPEFLRWTAYKFHGKSFNEIPNGIIYLKGGDVSQEVKDIRPFKSRVYELSDLFQEEYFLTKKVIRINR